MVIFVLFPIVNTIYLSFVQDDDGNLGLANYQDVLSRPAFINTRRPIAAGPPYGAFIHNIIWIVLHLPVTVIFGLLLAVLLRDVKGSAIIKSVIFLAMIIPMVVGGVFLRFMYDDDAGVVNGFLSLIGFGEIAQPWLRSANTSLLALIVGTVWIWTGFSMVVYSAGLEGIPVELYEAAKIDGASRWRTFWRVTVPQLRSATIVVVTMTLLWVLKVFDLVFIEFGGLGGSSSVMAFEMYLDAFQASKYGTASVWATLLTIMTFGFAAYMVKRMSEA
jgi:multiple sugar transport system permease protein